MFSFCVRRNTEDEILFCLLQLQNVHVCVGVLLMLWGNIYMFAQSYCGDPSSLWGQNVPIKETITFQCKDLV